MPASLPGIVPAVVPAATPGAMQTSPGAAESGAPLFIRMFGSPVNNTAVPADVKPAVPSTPGGHPSSPAAVTQARDAVGSMMQSSLGDLNKLLTGFVSKKSSGHVTSAAYLRPAEHTLINSLAASTFDLTHGEVILSASRRSTVIAGAHTVEAAAGAIVHVTRDGALLKVRNLCDSTGKGVNVFIAGKSVAVGVGEELVVGADEGTVNASVKGDNIGRRKVTRFLVDGKHALIKSELSIIALIQKSDLLTDMYSNGSPADKHVMQRVLKIAAALFQVTGKRGAYGSYDPSKLEPLVPLRSKADSEASLKVAHN